MILKPGMIVEIKKGPFQGSNAKVFKVCGSLVKANIELFGTVQEIDYSYDDFDIEYVPESKSFESLIERFDQLYHAAAPKRYELLQQGLGSDAADQCREIPGVASLPDELIQLYQWKNGMKHLADGWRNEFEGDGWWETTVLDNSVHFKSLEEIVATIVMWEEISRNATESNNPCYWRKGFVPFLEAPFWKLVVIDTFGLFGGEPYQIIEFDYKCANGFSVIHENLNKWLETQVERLAAGMMFQDWNEDSEWIIRGINEYYTRQFPKEISIDQLS